MNANNVRVFNSFFRVWPDGTVQAVEDGSPYSWMSDDYMVVEARSEAAALELAVQKGWL